MEQDEVVFLNRFGELFVKIIQSKLAASYPIGKGFDGTRPSDGDADKIANVHYGYNQSLYASVSYSVNGNNELDISMNSYWRNVNFGREPGSYAPITPQKLWAMERLGLGEKDAVSAAYGISTNLYKFGIQPTYFYDLAVEEMITKGVEQLGAEFEQAITNTINNKLFETDIQFDQELTINL